MTDKLWIALEIGFTSTIPQSVACLLFALSFWEVRIDSPWRKIPIFALWNVVNFMLFLLLPEALRPFSLVGYGICVFLLFREIAWRDRILLVFTLASLYTIVEITTAFVTISSGLVEREGLATDPRAIVPYLLLGNTVVAVVAGIMIFTRRSPGKAILLFLRQRQNRPLAGLVTVFAGNVIVTSTLFFYVMENHPFAASYTMVATSIVSVLILIFTVRSVTALKNKEILTTQETYVEEIDNLFTTIRGQRHDFLNHVQVIQAFVRKGKTEELERYVTELVGEIVEINDLIQIGHPALAALIKSKMVFALDRKIDLRYSFEGMDRIGRGIASVDYVKIAGNLLDNALDEVLHRPPEERWVEIQGWTDEENFYLSVSNPARSVTEEQKANMFRPGFTTKTKGAHSGLGLSIVKERVVHYQGEVEVEAEPDQVLSFRVKLPLRMRTIAP